MQKARCHTDVAVSTPTACMRMVSGSISLRCSRFFSPFLHSTGSLSVSQEYLALPDGAGRFPQGVSDLVVLRILLLSIIICLRDYHSLWFFFPKDSAKLLSHVAVLQPPENLNFRDLGSSLFARHYLGNHYCFLFLQVLRCFSSLGLPPGFHRDCPSSTDRVDLFGNLRIKDYLHLPGAYRSLSRPSSPLRAKAFAIRT